MVRLVQSVVVGSDNLKGLIRVTDTFIIQECYNFVHAKYNY